jgi:hypothetical protein
MTKKTRNDISHTPQKEWPNPVLKILGFMGVKKPRGGEPTDYYEAVECEMTLKLLK